MLSVRSKRSAARQRICINDISALRPDPGCCGRVWQGPSHHGRVTCRRKKFKPGCVTPAVWAGGHRPEAVRPRFACGSPGAGEGRKGLALSPPREGRLSARQGRVRARSDAPLARNPAGRAGPRPPLSCAVARLREAPKGAFSGRLYRTPVSTVELLAAPTPGGRRESSPRSAAAGGRPAGRGLTPADPSRRSCAGREAVLPLSFVVSRSRRRLHCRNAPVPGVGDHEFYDFRECHNLASRQMVGQDKRRGPRASPWTTTALSAQAILEVGPPPSRGPVPAGLA